MFKSEERHQIVEGQGGYGEEMRKQEIAKAIKAMKERRSFVVIATDGEVSEAISAIEARDIPSILMSMLKLGMELGATAEKVEEMIMEKLKEEGKL